MRYAIISGLLSIAAFLLAACGGAGPPPTPTPTPQPSVAGVHTPEDMRAQFAGWPDEYKLALNETVVILFAYPSQLLDWAGGAFLHHIPSVSSVVLFPVFSGDPRNYRNSEGRERLEAVLADESIMQSILAHIPEDTKRGRGIFDPVTVIEQSP